MLIFNNLFFIQYIIGIYILLPLGKRPLDVSSLETSLVPSDSSANLEKVKSQPARLEPQLIPALSFRSGGECQEPEVGEEEGAGEEAFRGKIQGKGCTKKTKMEISQDAEKLP